MKKCPFLKLGATPKSNIAGSNEMIIVMGNCLKEDCALWLDDRKVIDNEAVCAFLRIAERI